LGFGLGITVADVNKDGWLDMYVSNDYVEPDYIYINNHDGTFTDRLTEYVQHISYFSMGCDVNDINNDEWPDIFTVDMLPEDNRRQKLLYGPENYEHYALMVMNGFYFQNMRNMLHLNNGNGTYSEIGQCRARILVAIRAALTAALVAVRHVLGGAVVAGRDDPVFAHEDGADPIPDAVGPRAHGERDAHVVLGAFRSHHALHGIPPSGLRSRKGARAACPPQRPFSRCRSSIARCRFRQ
jgi:hypothetical protein